MFVLRKHIMFTTENENQRNTIFTRKTKSSITSKDLLFLVFLVLIYLYQNLIINLQNVRHYV